MTEELSNCDSLETVINYLVEICDKCYSER